MFFGLDCKLNYLETHVQSLWSLRSDSVRTAESWMRKTSRRLYKRAFGGRTPTLRTTVTNILLLLFWMSIISSPEVLHRYLSSRRLHLLISSSSLSNLSFLSLPSPLLFLSLSLCVFFLFSSLFFFCFASPRAWWRCSLCSFEKCG